MFPLSSAHPSINDGNGRPTPATRLLVIEDHAVLGRMLLDALSVEHEVELVSDEMAAFASVQNRPAGLMLIDLHACGHNTLGLLHALRMDPRNLGLPVLLLAATEDRELLLNCLAAGANDFLLKPFDLKDLFAAVRRELATRATQPT